MNLWSGSDYLQTVTSDTEGRNNFACTNGLNILQSVKEHSSNGDRSIKCNFPNRLNYCEYHIYDFDKTHSYTASFDIYTTSNMSLQCLVMANGSQVTYEGVVCPVNQLSTVSVTINQNQFTSETDEIKIRCLSLENNGVCYVDNWSVKKI